MNSRPGVTGAMLEARGLYRRALQERYGHVTLAGLAPDDEPILLRKIYVPLELTPNKVADDAKEEEIHADRRPLESWFETLEKFGQTYHMQPVLFVEGEAGGGKTTLVRAVTDSIAGEVCDTFNQRFGGRLPVPILLRDVPEARLSDLDALVDGWLADLADQAKRPLTQRKSAPSSTKAQASFFSMASTNSATSSAATVSCALSPATFGSPLAQMSKPTWRCSLPGQPDSRKSISPRMVLRFTSHHFQENRSASTSSAGSPCVHRA